MCLILDIPLIGENVIIFPNKTFQMLIFEQMHIIKLNFWYNFGTTERTYKVCVVETPAKMLDWCNIWPLISIFMD